MRRLSAQLPSYGWQPKLLVTGGLKNAQFDLGAFPAPSVVVSARTYPTLVRNIARHVVDFSPEVVVACPLPAPGIVMRHLYRTGASSARLIDTIHSDTPEAYRFVANRADVSAMVACASAAIADKACAWDRIRTKVARFFYPVPYPASMADRSRNTGALRIVYVATLQQRWKRVLDLPVLISHLVTSGVNFTLDIYGDGPERQVVETDIHEVVGTADRVRFHGRVANHEVLAALPDFDVFLLVSDTEGQSIAMMEAMACGLVPVVTNLCGARELIDDGNEGFLVRVGGIGDFVDRLALLARDRSRLLSMGASARNRISATNAESAAVGKFVELLDRSASLPLPDLRSLANDVFPPCRMERWRLPHAIQRFVRWKRGQWLN